MIEVQDTGPGVPDAMKQHIFDRFTQGDEQLGAIGSGLGLNITKVIVEHMGGTIGFTSPPDAGGRIGGVAGDAVAPHRRWGLGGGGACGAARHRHRRP